ncbi:hypothetical protein QFC21_000614 [Naganishia friedmannii]|uniref:Uncharacterized protein n=1 Tax=Naganishia friedmannii TaxID=89922 RepID=A0ACC2WC08_9TREE|nr:hypothetical protein QFC21_000614 [Naganishia friedmannii]
MAYYLAVVSPQDNPLYEALFSTSKNPSSIVPSSAGSGLGGGAATTLNSFPAWSTITAGLPPESLAFIREATTPGGTIKDPFPPNLLGGAGTGVPGAGAASAGKNDVGVEMHVLQLVAYSSIDTIEDVMIGNGSQNEEGIRLFFMDVWENYVKVSLNPFHTSNSLVQSQAFENRVRASARKHL